mmetsp:Transcript_55318/g.118957  ORF Transcript_55318/g.118957 Transcript_55318/m.118957 type:complete len:202 (-) Transcript_55318:1018-1623(-)
MVSGFAGCPAFSARSVLELIPTPVGSDLPVRCLSSDTCVSEAKRRLTSLARHAWRSRRWTRRLSSAKRSAMAGIAASTSELMAPSACNKPALVMFALASVTHSVTRFMHRGWSNGLNPLVDQYLVSAMRSTASSVCSAWSSYILPMTMAPTSAVVRALGSPSVRQSCAMTAEVNSIGKLPFPSASETHPTFVIFFAHTNWK